MMQPEAGDSETLELSLTPKAGLVLTLAAKAAGCPIEELVLQSALAHARATLPDRQHFGLDAEQWEAFMTALAASPGSLARISRLLKEPGVFDRDKLGSEEP